MRNGTILLVEDNPDDEFFTLQALAQGKIANKVTVVRDGVEALDYLFGTGAYAGNNAQPLPEVVLLDLKLPKCDGLGVLKALRADERTNLLPVIIFTSSKEEEDMILGYRGGANSYVTKPVDFKQFSEAVQQLGLYWMVLNQTPDSYSE